MRLRLPLSSLAIESAIGGSSAWSVEGPADENLLKNGSFTANSEKFPGQHHDRTLPSKVPSTHGPLELKARHASRQPYGLHTSLFSVDTWVRPSRMTIHGLH